MEILPVCSTSIPIMHSRPSLMTAVFTVINGLYKNNHHNSL